MKKKTHLTYAVLETYCVSHVFQYLEWFNHMPKKTFGTSQRKPSDLRRTDAAGDALRDDLVRLIIPLVYDSTYASLDDIS